MKIILLILITLIVIFFFIRLAQMRRGPQTQKNPSPFEKNKQRQEAKRKELKENPSNLSGDKLLLRPLSPLDRKPMSVIFSDPDAAAAIGIEPVKKYGQFLPYFNEELLDTIGTYGITILSSGRLVGYAELLPGDELEANIVIEALSRNHGFGTQALDILKEEAKKRGTSLIRVPKSKKEEDFLLKNGFKCEGNNYRYKEEKDE